MAAVAWAYRMKPEKRVMGEKEKKKIDVCGGRLKKRRTHNAAVISHKRTKDRGEMRAYEREREDKIISRFYILHPHVRSD